MIRTLKLTDITKTEVERVFQSIKYSNMLSYDIAENDYEIIVKCNVDDSNKFVFASVLRELEGFVYSDEDESPYDRFCSLVDVRKLKVGVVDQGFRGKLVEKLMSKGCNVDCFIGFKDTLEMQYYFESDNILEIAEKYAKYMKLDVVLIGIAETEGDGLISSLCKIAVYCKQNGSANKSYYHLGTANDIAEKNSFLVTALADKNIY